MEKRYYWFNEQDEKVGEGKEMPYSCKGQDVECVACSPIQRDDSPSLELLLDAFWEQVSVDQTADNIYIMTSRERAGRELEDVLYAWAQKHLIIGHGDGDVEHGEGDEDNEEE